MTRISKQLGFAPILLLVVAVVLGLIIATLRAATQTNNRSLLSTKATQEPISETSTTITAKEKKVNLEKYLTVQAALLGVSDHYSLYFKDLNSDNQIGIDPQRSWIPASTIKSFVVLEAFRQRRAGLIDFNQTVTITANNVVPTELETTDFPRLREGTQATIRQLIEAMVEQSDNTAYNTLLDVLDRGRITQSLRDIGITETVVGEKLNLDDTQFQQDLQVSGRQSNTTSAKDLATFFDLLYNHKLADSDEMLAIFKRQKLNNMIPALLPPDTQVAHKTGDWAPIYHDGGVVFKPDDPFILTIFTNSGEPSILSRLAKVAYYQNANSVSTSLSERNVDANLAQASSYPTISLAQTPSKDSVLGDQTPDTLLSVTASDLGINAQDLNIAPKRAEDVPPALVQPGSWFYQFKLGIENLNLKLSFDNIAKSRSYVEMAKHRLSEVKAEVRAGHLDQAKILTDQSESLLKAATDIAQKDPNNRDLLISEIKQIRDLHFATLAEGTTAVKNQQKEQYIDLVYDFYQKQHQDISPAINSSAVANPSQQKPAIATISSVNGNRATVTFEDGSSKQMLMPADTKIRSFGTENYLTTNSLTTGDKVAIIGLTNSNAQIIPQFILKNVPKDLPSQHQGTVIEINPDQNTLKILDKKGQEEVIQLNSQTLIKARDTGVSLAGIKAGSHVTIFGTTQQAAPTTQPLSSALSGGLFGGLTQLVQSITQGTKNSLTQPSATPISSVNPSIAPVPNLKSPIGTPLASLSPVSVPSAAPTTLPPTGNQSSQPTVSEGNQTQSKSNTPPAPVQPAKLNAITITVTNNSSGSKEKISAPTNQNRGSNQKNSPHR